MKKNNPSPSILSHFAPAVHSFYSKHFVNDIYPLKFYESLFIFSEPLLNGRGLS